MANYQHVVLNLPLSQLGVLAIHRRIINRDRSKTEETSKSTTTDTARIFPVYSLLNLILSPIFFTVATYLYY